MKLNVGCGEFYAEGWTNLDMVRTDTVRPDIVGSLLYLPDQVQDVTMVYLGHVLEHVGLIAARDALEELWARCVPGARVAMVGPDVDRAYVLCREGKIDALTLHGALHGANRWAGDAHLWECTEDRLLTLAQSSGLDASAVPIDDAELDPFPVASRALWQCAVVGKVP